MLKSEIYIYIYIFNRERERERGGGCYKVQVIYPLVLTKTSNSLTHKLIL